MGRAYIMNGEERNGYLVDWNAKKEEAVRKNRTWVRRYYLK
jgi:hypothetical protein